MERLRSVARTWPWTIGRRRDRGQDTSDNFSAFFHRYSGGGIWPENREDLGDSRN